MRWRNPKKDDVNACVLGRWAWDSDRTECGPDAPDPSTAARRLAEKRWQNSVRIQARELRSNTAAVIARAMSEAMSEAQARESNPVTPRLDSRRMHALAMRLSQGEI